MKKKHSQKKEPKKAWKMKNSQMGNIENIEREIEKSQKIISKRSFLKGGVFEEKLLRNFSSKTEALENKEDNLKNSQLKNAQSIGPKESSKKIDSKEFKLHIEKKPKENFEKITHKPVLLNEVIDHLELKEGDMVFDGTLGQGGYSEEILKKIGKNGKLIATDLDADAIEFSKRRLKKYLSHKLFFQRNFSEIDTIMKETETQNIDKVTLDLGFGSHQLDLSGRGISFLKEDEPLNMNLSTENSDLTAKEILNYWKEETLADIFSAFGGEKHARLAARKIVEERKIKDFEKVGDLVKLLIGVLGPFYKKQKIHPATRIFQALRITVNNELGNLEKALENILKYLSKDGLVAIVTFHSLEDKIVKKYFRKLEDDMVGQRVNRKVIFPSNDEVDKNPRARSAKLRVFKKTPREKNKYKKSIKNKN